MKDLIKIFPNNEPFENNSSDSNDYGNKGSNLLKMSEWDIPIPPGFILPNNICNEILKTGRINSKTKKEILLSLRKLEKLTHKDYGGESPLLISIRSSPPVSMPGMMDTIINVGIDKNTIKNLIVFSKDKKFPLDCYQRFLSSYLNIVYKTPYIIDENKKSIKEIELTIKTLLSKLPKIHNIEDHLFSGIISIVKSWNNPRAIKYRNNKNIPHGDGTSVIIQSMIFGNLSNSYTGVLFTRSPVDGNKSIFGEYTLNQQGPNLVEGITTPLNLNKLENKKILSELKKISLNLEDKFKDMMDIEFTIENNKIYILQSRVGKRTSIAANKIAEDMFKEGLINEQTYLSRKPKNIKKPSTISIPSNSILIGIGTPACPGIAEGYLTTNPHSEISGKKILCRPYTTPEDVCNLEDFEALITAEGGVTSHAGILSREIEKPCICAIKTLKINKKYITINGYKVKEGSKIIINGYNGKIFKI